MTDHRLALATATDGTDEPPLWLSRPDIGLFAVADPVGGRDEAVEVSFESLVSVIGSLNPATRDDDHLVEHLRTAVLAAQTRWSKFENAAPSLRGVGAALVAVLLGKRAAAIAHLGDCRAYQLRDGEILQQTTALSAWGRPRS